MVNVPKDFQDYDDDDPELEKRQNRQKYWRALKEIRNEYLKETIDTDYDAVRFLTWVEEKYGFRPAMFDSYLTDDFEVVDQKKFIVYILKYGK